MENYKVSESTGRREEVGKQATVNGTTSGMARCGKASEAIKECRCAKANNKCIIKQKESRAEVTRRDPDRGCPIKDPRVLENTE